ncbi:MAG TPA: carboxypeptidase-like regulatory domain-containing protein [Holophagaceae bacterium]|nr:carboxypeptidase-like regulatory domain-containing protein [Holophagaceae bacterium]
MGTVLPLLCALTWLPMALPLGAQPQDPIPVGTETRTSFKAIVRNSEGAPVPHAQVSLKGASQTFGLTTDEAGTCQIRQVPVGRYKVRVLLSGLSMLEREVTLGVGGTSTFNLQLEGPIPVATPDPRPTSPGPPAEGVQITTESFSGSGRGALKQTLEGAASRKTWLISIIPVEADHSLLVYSSHRPPDHQGYELILLPGPLTAEGLQKTLQAYASDKRFIGLHRLIDGSCLLVFSNV